MNSSNRSIKTERGSSITRRPPRSLRRKRSHLERRSSLMSTTIQSSTPWTRLSRSSSTKTWTIWQKRSSTISRELRSRLPSYSQRWLISKATTTNSQTKLYSRSFLTLWAHNKSKRGFCKSEKRGRRSFWSHLQATMGHAQERTEGSKSKRIRRDSRLNQTQCLIEASSYQ